MVDRQAAVSLAPDPLRVSFGGPWQASASNQARTSSTPGTGLRSTHRACRMRQAGLEAYNLGGGLCDLQRRTAPREPIQLVSGDPQSSPG